MNKGAKEGEFGYQELAEAMPQQVWTAKPDGRLDYVNQRVLDYFNRTSEQLLGEGWLQCVHLDDREPVINRWIHSLQSGDPYEVEFRLQRSDQQAYRWHLARAVPVRDQSGGIVRWLGTNTDIDDRRQIEEELRAARAQADAASAAKSDFLSSMSHELRTPLNAVIGYSEMLEEEATEMGLDAFAADLRKIHGAAGYLQQLITHVLDLQRIEAGKADLSIATFALPPFVSDVANTSQPLIQRSGNTLVLDCPASAGELTSDATKVKQCLLNLLSNAARFTEKGTIRLSVETDPDTVFFTVSDTGKGMNEEQLAKLFKPFSQVHAGQVDGTGLGLLITRRLCDLLQGEVSVISEPGRGSQFKLTFPRTRDL